MKGRKKVYSRSMRRSLPLFWIGKDAASEIRDMNYPGSYLHLLEPKADNRWAVKVSGNWRITFRFLESAAYEINYEDYH
jgi:proteic killer suppression protein